ncbi:MAG: 1,4-alpha-glucan branching protein GlgB [Deltaproteobacteria bacterium]|nr:1,4-alpha-glucan branching protein GlgB [Deltaproteobacteria bacterium]
MKVRYDISLFTDYDIFLFKQGNHSRFYEKCGSHPMTTDGGKGTFFAVWAPNAKQVAVVGDFNAWTPESHTLRPRDDESGVWEGFIPGIAEGTVYKYHIISSHHDYRVMKGDPFAFYWETPPKTASVVWNHDYEWSDSEWMTNRHQSNALDAPMSIYEVHLGSWRRVAEDTGNRPLSYRELAQQLSEYVSEMGFTHVEFLPIMEHPFYGSWGYQTVGYFAPTSRYGTPQDFMYLIDRLHQHGIGVILDWVPSHFPSDEHGLSYFDGTYLYEHADPQKGFHPEWQSYIFNHGRHEVQTFLISSALFWLERYHADGLRVDAVASMLYLDYARKDGEWIPNKYGGNENIEAINFIRSLNEAVYAHHPHTQTFAEESTAWPMVSRPTYVGGLGFGMKWNMGWMHDTLDYFSKEPIHRKYHHNQLTFSIWYAFFENFLLPLSHDEVVHGKRSLIAKMPGDDWQKFATVRLLFGYLYAHPGKKLLFMGGEFAQWGEWYHEESLDWHLLEYAPHQGVRKWVRDLNHLYKNERALYRFDFENRGFEWVDCHDWEGSIISFLREGDDHDDTMLVVCNFTPVPRYRYRIGVPREGTWWEVLNSDAAEYGGSGCGNGGRAEAETIPSYGRPFSLSITLPPLGILLFRHENP